jgi:tetratricopeptide (TPR) repeat protein
MSKKPRRRTNWFRILVLIVLIGVALYINQVVVPATPPLFIPTATPTRSPEAIINQADQLFDEGKLSQSVDAYEEAISVDPTNPSNYVNLARAQVWLGQYDEAILNTQNALLQNPNNPMAHAVQAWALSFQEKHNEAEIEIKKALELDPNNALAHAYFAEILINQNDFALYEQAANESKFALQMDPNALETHRIRGIVLYNTQNLEQAVDEFQAAIAINKNIANLHLYLGVTYKALGQYDLAQEALLAGYALNPDDTIALTELSRAYFADGRFAQAAQYAEEAIKVESADPRLHGNLGIVYYKNNDYSNAIDHLALTVRGGYTEDGDPVEGLPLEYGRVEEYYWYYGFALARSGRCAEAVPVFQELLIGVPEDEIAVYNAQEGLAICQQDPEPAQTPTSTPETESTPTVEG